MEFILLVCFLVISFCIVRIFSLVVNFCKYRQKEKQLAQLKEIYAYLKACDTNPVEAEKIRTKDMKIEDGWLYTKNFYFDLYDNSALDKVQKYLLELMGFFLAYDYTCNRKNFESMVEFKKDLNMILGT